MSEFMISIIVPVYNVEDYLDDCICSLVRQTYKNIEIILIDDGSTDASASICDHWESVDNRINVIHTENRGVSHARNVGLENIHGDYISFIDADDWIEPDTYECLLSKMEDNKAGVAGGGYTREESDGEKISLRQENPGIYSREEILLEIFSDNVPKLLGWELCDKLFSKELVVDVRFDEKISAAEDMLFLWQVMQKAKKFVYIPLFKYHYRNRHGSACNSEISPKKISSYYALEKIWNMAQDEKDNLRKVIFVRYVLNILLNTRRMLAFDSVYYAEDIQKNQAIIRTDLYKIIFNVHMSMKQKLWLSLLCLPYKFIRYLIPIIKFRLY